jgi:hypothetical protein
MNEACRAILSSLKVVKDMSKPVRSRLSAPLVGPPHFGSAREYRTWKKARNTSPQTASPLQWPLAIWLLLGLVLMLSVGSFLS